jgi:hypothetical protein
MSVTGHYQSNNILSNFGAEIVFPTKCQIPLFNGEFQKHSKNIKIKCAQMYIICEKNVQKFNIKIYKYAK